MNIINPSATILEDNTTILEGIERRGRICYQSEHKIQPGSAAKFFDNILNRKHMSVLEMRTVSVGVPKSCARLAFDILDASPYFDCDQHPRMPKGNYIVTGTVRAWIEFFQHHGTASKGDLGWHSLYSQVMGHVQGVSFGAIAGNPFVIRDIEILRNYSVYPTHKWVAVKFVVNRAVSHELVRHRNKTGILQESQRYCRAIDSNGGGVTFIKPMFWDEGREEYLIWEKAMQETERIYLKLLETSSPQAARTVLPNSCKTELILHANLAQWNHILFQRTSPAAEPSMREVMIPLLEEFKARWPECFGDLKQSVCGR